jgi:hypothetical protein
MNSLKMILAACAFVTVSQRVWSAELQTNEVLTVILELVDGSRVIGTPGVEAVAMQTPYAKVSLPLKQILSITMEADHENASFYLKNGDKLTGVMTLGPIPLTTAFGKVTVAVEHIRQLAVMTGGNNGGTRKGLIAWYTFDDGTAKDTSEFGNHGILHDVKTAPDRFKRMDSALAFNGRTSWIEVPSSRVYDSLAEITIAVWVCPTDVPRGTTRAYNLLSKQPSGSLSQQHGPTTSNHGGLFDVNLNFNGEAWEVSFGSQVSEGMCTEGHGFPLQTQIGGQWQHLAVTASRAENRVCAYLNGKKVGDLVYKDQVATGRILSHPTSEPLRIGKRKDADFNTNGNLYFGGSMDDVRIYNRVLTDDEISGICGPRD